jgi:ribonuclease HI
MKRVICYTDGGARGNPGPAAIGVYITDEAGVMMSEVGQTIGNSTNNFAEYQAVLVALQTLRVMLGDETAITDIEIRLDSELVKKQLNAEYQIKEPGFVPMFIEIHNMRVSSFPHLTFTHIPREENSEADRLVNEALDIKQ